MKITINSVEITDDQYSLVASVRGSAREAYNYSITRDIEKMVVDIIVTKVSEKFLQDHMHEILGKIDQQQIQNMIVLRASKSIING